MKITAVYGQNHKGSTCRIARMLAEKLGGEITEFFLPRDFGDYCTGCMNCIKKQESLCPHYRTLLPLTQAMDEADVLILASPVYVYHVTGPMKSFLDHYGYRWMVHRPEERMFSKQAVCISTAAGAGMKSANQDMADSLFFWGVPKIYRFGVAVHAASYERIDPKTAAGIEREISRLADTIRAEAGKVRPGLKTTGFFHLVRKLHRGNWNQADVLYWREKGWDREKRPWKREK